ncbi:peptidoglycan D,D-transpeptidase FtsI family protein [Aureimonas glaciei]|uniref:Penicillin-binding protein 3 n=1 Tax=Aureimonas glaciei TaxID=1776957 RepID=A0A916XY25_9HYPH|nr:penicillin-binding protein 2 [Aureimonas glaciei]GGD20756.1 penicillin-binding protein 3 [Aureimonas glaciei]
MIKLPKLPRRQAPAAAEGGPASAPTRAFSRRRPVEAPRNRQRFFIAIGLFCCVYAVIGGRLVMWGSLPTDGGGYQARAQVVAARPDLVDRNGQVLATDIKTASLFAEPRRIVDPDEAGELLRTVLPDLDAKYLHTRLASDAGFVWLRRELTPRQQQEIFALGIPGIGFRTEKRRFYPGGNTASHIVGSVNVDNQGIAGMEKYVDDQGLRDIQNLGLAANNELEPVKLSIDLRVQHIMRDELAAAIVRYRAIAAAGIILDVTTGEVVAMVSMPDFDPNNPVEALKKENLNRMSAGLFEMGSTFKSFTTAMALDSGLVKITDMFSTEPFRVSGFTIKEFHSKHRPLSVPEIFQYSSNVGSAREADIVGIEGHKAFLTKLGLLSRIQTELPEVATPTQPKQWKKINSMTISYGHGISTTPLQTAVAAAALMNGGYLIPPTFLPRTAEEAQKLAVQVISKKTSDEMRYMYELNGEHGSGRQALAPGYRVGGKTGTAEKVVNGRYVGNKRFNGYLAAFPMDAPRYVTLVVVDEPQPVPGSGQGATAASNAAPTAGAIIRRSAALLGVKPDFGDRGKSLLVSY